MRERRIHLDKHRGLCYNNPHNIYGEVLKWSKRRDSKSRRALTRRVGSNPTFSANKKRTFVYQKFSFCLSKPQAWYIIDARSAAYIISPFGAVSHHAPACIPCGLMIYNTSCW